MAGGWLAAIVLILACVAIEPVESGIAVEPIIACDPSQLIIPAVAEQLVIARAAKELIVADTATDDIIAFQASKQIRAAQTLSQIRACGAYKEFTGGGAHDHGGKAMTSCRRRGPLTDKLVMTAIAGGAAIAGAILGALDATLIHGRRWTGAVVDRIDRGPAGDQRMSFRRPDVAGEHEVKNGA